MPNTTYPLTPRQTSNVLPCYVYTTGFQNPVAYTSIFGENYSRFMKCPACVQVVSRQKLNSNRENIVLYSINLDVFSIVVEFLTINDLSPVHWKQNIDIKSRKHRDLLHKPRCFLDWKSMFCFQWTGLKSPITLSAWLRFDVWWCNRV